MNLRKHISSEESENNYDEFEKSRLISKENPFHDSVKRNKVKLVKDSIVNSTIKTKDKETIIEVNRNILGKLLQIRTKDCQSKQPNDRVEAFLGV